MVTVSSQVGGVRIIWYQRWLRVSSQVDGVRIIWYQSQGSSLGFILSLCFCFLFKSIVYCCWFVVRIIRYHFMCNSYCFTSISDDLDLRTNPFQEEGNDEDLSSTKARQPADSKG
ncbi:hypothetical protein ACOSQ2_021410 [Xanthoceras sorbifolium]